MDKKDHIKYWKSTADKDWKVVQSLYSDKQYVHCAFFAHLVLEKLLKAHWVKDNTTDIPPRTHNLLQLYHATKLNLLSDDISFLRKMNEFQLEGRYPDYQMKIYKSMNKGTTLLLVSQIETLRKCLLKKL